jgi:predicted CXXCH cytochrome family protein
MGLIAGALALFALTDLSSAAYHDAQSGEAVAAAILNQNPDDYVGSEACKKCHEDQVGRFAGTQHARMAHSKFDNGMNRGCEVCHGPGKAHTLAETKRKEAMDTGADVPDYDPNLIISFRGKSPKDVSDNCLKCHSGRDEEHANYRRGEHWRNDVGCTDCHDPHGQPLPPDRPGSQTLLDSATKHKADWGALVMLKQSEPQLCLKCHNEMRAQFSMPFRHHVLEGQMTCSDCHNPHGGFELKQARLATSNDSICVKCHTDKQGPFAFEHAPLKTEGCTACHNPHGSANPRLLKRADVFQLCLECHTDAHGIGAPNTPSFHNLAQEKWRNCTTCHQAIHGSNSHPLYFR